MLQTTKAPTSHQDGGGFYFGAYCLGVLRQIENRVRPGIGGEGAIVMIANESHLTFATGFPFTLAAEYNQFRHPVRRYVATQYNVMPSLDWFSGECSQSHPRRKRVREIRTCSKYRRPQLVSASTTVAVSLLATLTSMVKRECRSTRVAM
jgi:hypothetical protein